jgi:flagellar biosynthesis chaperone FliJ
MHATRGGGVWPSYFCGTYAKHGGLQNPTGCHCHRVKHSVIEKYVSQYLKDTDKFLSGDASLTLPLVLDYAGAENRQDDLYEAMFEMVGKRIKEKGSIVEIYGKVFDRIRPKIEQQIQVKENALERMIDDFRGISEKARPRINQRVDLLQGEIDSLKSQLIDLRQPVESVREEVKERKETLKKAFKMLSSNSGRQRAEALHNVLDKIVCHFRYVGNKSYLDKVEIVPISSENLVVTGGNMPGLN